MGNTSVSSLEMQFDEMLTRLKYNKEVRDSGKFICIPWPFPRLAKILPGIKRGLHIGLTAGTGISKSKFSRFIFIYTVYKFITENPNCGIKPKIFLFLLEDSKEEVMISLTCHHLKVEYKIDIDPQDLESAGGVLTSEQLELVARCRNYFKDLGQYLVMIDNIHNPFGIYKEVRDYMELQGTVEYEEKTDEEGNSVKIGKSYIPNNPEEHVMVVMDNLSNLTKEAKHSSTWDAMGEWTSKYARRLLCKFFHCTVITIQQQDLESQKLAFSMYQGEAIKGKVKPSLASLGDNKQTSRDYHLILGLFSPERFKFDEDLGYDITILKDSYRNLSVLKSNGTRSGYEVGLYFNGAAEQFIELPHPQRQPQDLQQFYERVKQRR